MELGGMEVRHRRNTKPEEDHLAPSELLQNLDIFPKLPKECKKSTNSGGIVTILTLLLMFILFISEIYRYIDPDYVYSYEVDKDFEGKIQINIDITVATRCEYTSLDVVDVIGSTMSSKGKMKYHRATFELSGPRRVEFERRRDTANVLRTHHHVLHEALWKRHDVFFSEEEWEDILRREHRTPERGSHQDVYNACRMVGTLFVRKVAGNIHMVPGKPILGLGGAHVHIASLLDKEFFNFSHRIDHLSFGPRLRNRVDPLEAVEQIAHSPMETFQYYLSIVPTRVVHTFSTSDTYQYAVAMKNQSVNDTQQSKNIPGIFFSYDTFPLVIKVTEARELLGTFLARLAALVGGLFATVGYVRQILGGVPEFVHQTKFGRRLETRWSRCKHQLALKLNEAQSNGCATGNVNNMNPPPLDPDSDT